jgi:hypothetical protein
MRLTHQLKLLPTAPQAEALRDTLCRFNEAATFAARSGFEARVFSKPGIQKRCYQELRSHFGLSVKWPSGLSPRRRNVSPATRRLVPSSAPTGL